MQSIARRNQCHASSPYFSAYCCCSGCQIPGGVRDIRLGAELAKAVTETSLTAFLFYGTPGGEGDDDIPVYALMIP